MQSVLVLGTLICASGALHAKGVMNLVRDAFEDPADARFVCQTFVLAAPQPESPDWFTMAAFTQSLVIPTVTVYKEGPTPVNFFNRDRLPSEILHPLRLGCLRFTPQCSVVVVTGPSVQKIHSITEYVASERLVRTTRDNFIFYGEANVMTSLTGSPLLSFLTFKHIVHKISSIVKQDSVTVVTNYCDETPTVDRLHFFRRSCKNFANGRPLRAAVLIGEPHYRYQRNAAGELVPGGSYHLLYAEISKRLNATTDLYMVKSAGTKINGSWSGASGELASRRADATFPTLAVASRNLVMDTSRLLNLMDKVFWVKVPEKGTRPTAVLQPFTIATWACLFVATAAVTLIVNISLRADTFGDVSLATVHGSILRPLVEQPVPLQHYDSGDLARIILLCWSICCVTLCTAYRSKMFQFLTFQEPDPFPRTYDELAFDFSEYKILYRSYGGVADRYLLQSNDPMHRALVKNNNRLKVVNAAEECITGIFKRGKKVACIDFDFAGEYSIVANATLHAQAESRGTPILRRSLDNDGRYLIVWGFWKGSPLRDIVDDVIAWTMDCELFEYWIKMDWRERMYAGMRHLKQEKSDLRAELENDERETRVRVKAFKIHAIQIPIYMLFCGMVVACCVLMWESGQVVSAVLKGIAAVRLFFNSLIGGKSNSRDDSSENIDFSHTLISKF